MRVQRVLGFVIVGLTALVLPSSAEACSCGGTISSSVAFNGADVVFVGTSFAVLTRGMSWLSATEPAAINRSSKAKPGLSTRGLARDASQRRNAV